MLYIYMFHVLAKTRWINLIHLSVIQLAYLNKKKGFPVLHIDGYIISLPKCPFSVESIKKKWEEFFETYITHKQKRANQIY